MSTRHIYRISFINQGKLYELYARKVYQADLYGFVVAEDLVFGRRSTVVVDPGEEKLKTEFESVKRTFIPMHAVLRVDEVAKAGVAKISDVGDKIAHLPSPIYTPGGKSGA